MTRREILENVYESGRDDEEFSPLSREETISGSKKAVIDQALAELNKLDLTEKEIAKIIRDYVFTDEGKEREGALAGLFYNPLAHAIYEAMKKKKNKGSNENV